ncbi:hypothetical protein [Pseudomonas sp. RIT-PI-AD]|uniref:hypothetical protein n=1 Tax=Pseudomonas sp. RIT-PI-AD TaxID=3035294 RepID=UPI0021D92B91|nr:hypothetical protein [Pseudomonas sp. RIT-PI-AD]
MKITREQYAALCAAYNAEQREAFVRLVRHEWRQAQARLVPGFPILDDATLTAWVEACHDDCLAHDVLEKSLVINYAFQVLRAVNLGARHEFIQGLRNHFLSERTGRRQALEWIAFIVGGAQDSMSASNTETPKGRT